MFREKIKALRESRGLTKKQLAKAIGVSERAYITYEYGQREPSMETIVNLAKYFGVTTDYLLDMDNAKALNPIDLLDLPPLAKAIFSVYVAVSPQNKQIIENIFRESAKGADLQKIMEILNELNKSEEPERKPTQMTAVKSVDLYADNADSDEDSAQTA